MYCLRNLLYSDVPLLYYVNLNSSIIYCIFSGEIYLSFGISVSSKLFCECDFFEDFDALVIFSVISLPIKSPVDFAAF